MGNSFLRPAYCAFLVTALAGTPFAYADDTEIFNSAPVSTGAPNILFILDTSGSMGSTVIKPDPYDPTQTYTGSCNSSLIYYSATGTPGCGRSALTLPESAMVCSAALTALYNNGSSSGTYSGNAIRWLVTDVNTSSTSTTATTTQKYITTYSTTQPATQLWVKSGSKWKTSGGVIAGAPITTGPETSTPSGSPTKGSTSPTSPIVTDVYTYTWTTVLAAPTNTSSTSKPTSTTASSSTTTQGTASVASTSTTAVTGAPGGSTPGTSYTQNLILTTNYKRTDSVYTITGNTTSTVTTTTTYTASDVECDGDKTNGTPPSGNFPNNVNLTSASSEWTTTKANSYWDTGGGIKLYNFYSGNYINYAANPPGTNEGTRIQVVQQAASNLIDNLSGVNVGLMRYSDNSADAACRLNSDLCAMGGMVTFPMSPIDNSTTQGQANKTAFKTVLNSYSAGGWTPLSETLYEAYLYYSGGTVHFGNTSETSSGASPSVKGSRTGNTLLSNTYQTPITSSCQPNYIVYLTDGLPTQDNQADSLIQGLPNFASLGGGCDNASNPPYGSGWGPGNSAGVCLGGLAQYMYNSDLNSSLSGQQKVATYFVGFGSDFVTNGQLNSAFTYLQNAATRGGGIAYQAGDSDQLTTTLQSIVTDIWKRSVSFVAPAIAVDAFNRSQTLGDMFFSVFQPSATAHWPGNVKKYRFANGQIEDANGQPAVNPATGFFNHGAQSIWSTAADGEDVTSGGAANRIPDPTPRSVYTFIGSNPGSAVDLTTSGNYSVDPSNSLLTNSVLKIGNAGDPSATTLLNWARGMDVNDDNGNGSTTDARHVMGDPLHSRPTAVVYGGTEAAPDIVLFASTNDGYLHAIGGTDGDGHELWAFIPQDFLGDLVTLYKNAPTSPRHYGLDGDVVVIKYDVNGDGIIQPSQGDKVILYVGAGRGGSHYYALDVTDRYHPKFMWSIGPSELPGIGQAWSTPVYGRIKIAGATQNSQDLALFIGGGYDPSEDNSGYQTADSVGNHLYIVDALYGTLLWSDANVHMSQPGHALDHAIPSTLALIDLDGDTFIDRIYVGDVAGQIWRFDVTNGNDQSSLVAGGVIASLGTHDESPHVDANHRRFYYPPSVALVQHPRQLAYFSLAIGSGYRGHPLETTTQDRFYSVRDFSPFAPKTQAQFDALTPITDAALIDVTDLTAKPLNTDPGWKILLNVAGGWDGEKVLGPATTTNYTVGFNTYTPAASSVVSASGCTTTSVGSNLHYTVTLEDGYPLLTASGEVPTDPTARYVHLSQTGIAPGMVVLYTNDGPYECSGAECTSCPTCGTGLNKTYWRSSDSE